MFFVQCFFVQFFIQYLLFNEYSTPKLKNQSFFNIRRIKSMPNLIITEKPSVAKSISAVLNANKRENGFFSGNNYIVAYCFGHLLELAQPDAYGEQYAKWRYADLPIIPSQWKYTPLLKSKKQLDTVCGLMNRSDVKMIVEATDAGREGELIFRLVYEHAGCTKPFKRLWISSMEDAAIREGFNNLKDGAEYDNL